MDAHVVIRLTVAEARILREMAANRLFALESLPTDERSETAQEMAAARRAVQKLNKAALGSAPS